MQQKIDKMQEELMKVQLKYQKELEKLERDNKELRKQLLLKGHSGSANRKIKVVRIVVSYLCWQNNESMPLFTYRSL